MRILLIDDNDPFRHFLVTTLENHLKNVDVVEATSLKVAKLLYESDPYFESIMVSLDISSGSALSLIHHFQDFNKKTPIVTYSSEEQASEIPDTFFLDKGTKAKRSPKIFVEALLNHPTYQKYLRDNQSHKQYARIKIFYLWRFEELPIDLYVKINDKKYVKILAKNTKYDEAFIEKYHTSKNEYLFIESKDYEILESLLYSDQWFEESNELSDEEKNFRMKKIIQQMASSMGLTPHLIQKAEEVVQSVISSISESKNLNQIFKRQQKRMSFQTNVSTLITYITSALCDELEWNTQSSKEKLGFAAIFHDTSLKSAKLSSIYYLNLDELNQLSLTEEEKKKFFQHPVRSAEIVNEINLKFPHVETIILNHHERPDGSGFPMGKNFQKIPPLSSLFIIAHDYVMRSILNRFDKNPSDILKEMSSHYQNGHFEKCFTALEKIIDN